MTPNDEQLVITLALVQKHGLRVVLLGKRKKSPTTKTWETTTDIRVVEKHLLNGSNIGLVCGPKPAASGLIVLDFDEPEIMQEMFTDLGALPLTVQTGSGKFHAYFAWQQHLPAKLWWAGKRVGEIQRGTDHDGNPVLQQVVMPPSIHPDTGIPYRWIQDTSRGYEPLKLIPSLPEKWIAHLVHEKPKEEKIHIAVDSSEKERLEWAKVWLSYRKPAIQGQHGDEWTYKTAAHLVIGYNLSDSAAMTCLMQWNQKCQPPWDERELWAKVRSAAKSGKGTRGDHLQYHVKGFPSFVTPGDTRGLMPKQEAAPTEKPSFLRKPSFLSKPF